MNEDTLRLAGAIMFAWLALHLWARAVELHLRWKIERMHWERAMREAP